MTATLTVSDAESDRTDIQALRAAPVSLPAGSYDLEELTKRLNETALAKHDEKRDEMREKAIADLNETVLPTDTLGLTPGYDRREVVDENAGVTEERVVFNPDKVEDAERAQEDYQEPIDPAKSADPAPASKGE